MTENWNIIGRCTNIVACKSCCRLLMPWLRYSDGDRCSCPCWCDRKCINWQVLIIALEKYAFEARTYQRSKNSIQFRVWAVVHVLDFHLPLTNNIIIWTNPLTSKWTPTPTSVIYEKLIKGGWDRRGQSHREDTFSFYTFLFLFHFF